MDITHTERSTWNTAKQKHTVNVGLSTTHALPMDPIDINTAVATNIFFLPIMSARLPATSWPTMLPNSAAEATPPCSACRLPPFEYSEYSSLSSRNTRFITNKSYL